MSLDMQIIQLLLGNTVRQINFSLRGLLVTGRGFEELSFCFSDTPIRHRIRILVRPELISRTADAEYHSDTDKLLFRTPAVLQTYVGRATVVHECTHALLDLRSRASSVRSEESAAFIAEAWYLLNCGYDPVDVNNYLTVFGNIAENLRQQAMTSGGGATPIELSVEQINAARAQTGRLGYTSGHYTKNGIRGLRYRGN
ncbi:MAG: hypothetical protein R2747_17375 [Pyrinomonadaceae bacterium]